MLLNNSKQDYFPLKPKKKYGFKQPVSWLGGRELVSSLKAIIIYSIYGENIDPRSWMKSNIYPSLDENHSTAADVDQAWAEKTAECREWKQTRFKFWEDYQTHLSKTGKNNSDEFWFDYIADSGDGQMGVYGVACLCLSDLWMSGADEKGHQKIKFAPPSAENFDKETLLPRGSMLFVGGDTAYHVADYSALHERFQNPFRWAFADVRKYMVEKYGLKTGAEKFFILGKETKSITDELWNGMLSKINETDPEVFLDTEPVRPLFGVPANHDYYDDLDGFNRQFRRPPYKDVQENLFNESSPDGFPLAIPTFQREQEASYTAIRLPFDWWLLGIDSENEKLDFRQRRFYKDLEEQKLKKVILATPEPTTVFGKKCNETDKTANYLKEITNFLGFQQPFLNDGDFLPFSPDDKGNQTVAAPGDYCRLDLSGDVHHYARYWGPNRDENDPRTQFQSKHYASLVAGGGGAFFDPTETLFGKSEIMKNGRKTGVAGEIPPQITFPVPKDSRNAVADRIFDLWNIRKGGYVQIAGAIIAVIIFYALTSDYLSFHFSANRSSDIQEFFRLILNSSISEFFGGAYLGLYLLLSAAFLAVSGYKLHDLIVQLKNVRAKNITEKNKDKRGKIAELKIPFYSFIGGLFFYFLLFFGLQEINEGYFSSGLFAPSGYAKTLLLLLNFIIAGVIIWLSIEYSNWLILRFKFLSESKETADSWINLFVDTPVTERIEAFLGSENSWLRRIWVWYRNKSVESIPIFLLNGIAVTVLIVGIYNFGNRPLTLIAVEIVFSIAALGGFFGLIVFAVSTGAQKHNGAGKLIFTVIGLWHALLQIAAPFLLIFFADWRLVIAIFALTVLTNGFAFQLGAWVMKRDSAVLLSVVWFVYGAIVLFTPFLFGKLQGNRTIDEAAAGAVNYLTGFSADWLTFTIAILLAGFLGYRISRVWFSWYLAVSLAFNGHNNEAGGAARIEGFKHILRIKVENEKLTVFVIGFDEAATDLNQLNLKLVDKFELKCKSIP